MNLYLDNILDHLNVVTEKMIDSSFRRFKGNVEIEVIIRRKIEEVMGVEGAESILVDEDLKEYGMDSLNAIELVVELEMEFGIEFREDDLLLDNLCSIKKLVDIVQDYIES